MPRNKTKRPSNPRLTRRLCKPAALPPALRADSPPDHLSATSRQIWQSVVKEFDGISDSDLSILLGGLECRDLAEEAKATLRREGFLKGNRTHPAVAAARSMDLSFLAACRALGLHLAQEGD